MFKLAAPAREREPDTRVPFGNRAAPGTRLLDDSSEPSVIHLAGVACEMPDPEAVNTRHIQHSILLRSIADV